MSFRHGAGVLLLLAACSKAETTEVEVEVRTVGMDRISQSPVVLLQDKGHAIGLPIWIGPAEAQAIAMQLEGLSAPRPSTHDLMKNLLVQSGVELDRVVIGDLIDRTYTAQIHLVADGRGVEVDSRPSDAIALAVRFKKPIFVARALLRGSGAIDIQKMFGSETLELRGLTVQALSADLAEVFGIDTVEGVLVSGVAPGLAGIQSGDRILAVGGRPVLNLSQFAEQMRAVGGAEVTLQIERSDQQLEVVLPASG
jgi:uncharacterized protein